MPGFDRTGPRGEGPRTGRQMGKCKPRPGPDDPGKSDTDNELLENGDLYFRGRGPGRGMGFGRGRGPGRGRGGGQGRGRHRFRGGDGPGPTN